jgi:hypothetical protein
MSLKRVIIIAVFAAIIIVALVLLSIFNQWFPSGPPTGTGDPGNSRLNELANDTVFSTLPPNSQQNGSIIKTPAQYTKPGFEPGGWRGPSVELTFTTDESQATIYQFYSTRAAETGWQPRSRDSDGYIYAWTKAYPDSAHASLILYGPEEGAYRLVGSIAAIDSNTK